MTSPTSPKSAADLAREVMSEFGRGIYVDTTLRILARSVLASEAENERLRAALEQAADMLDHVAPRATLTGADDSRLLSVRHTARAALSPKAPESKGARMTDDVVKLRGL